MITDLLVSLPWILALASVVYHLASLHAARRFFSRAAPRLEGDMPPVSVLIPLCGTDFGAYQSYAALCRQDYPEFQLVFGVMDPHDSSIAVIRRLEAHFPALDIELVIDATTLGTNPKISNLRNMLAHARHRTLVLLDSDIRVAPGFLRRVVPEIQDEGVGLVTCFYRGAEASGLAAKVEAIGITAEFAPGVLVAWLTEGISFALGAVVGTTRERLEAIGGFEALADHLADDYVLGQLFRKAGYDVRLLPEVVETVLPRVSFPELLHHQVRWNRGIRACRPWGHAGLIFTHATVMALAAWAFSGGSLPIILLLGGVVAVRLWTGWVVGVRYLGDELLARHLFLLPLRDAFSFLVWCLSLGGRRVQWRGRCYLIVDGGRMAEEPSCGAIP